MSAEPTWLVVVDMQVIFADPYSPWVTPDFPRIVEPVRRLVGAAGSRVVYTRFVAPQRAEGAWVAYYAQWPFALQPPMAPSYQIVDTLTPGEQQVISLPTFGKWGPELDQSVGGSRDVVLVGVSTDSCVLSTALGAADAGVRVRVVADACAGLSDEDHRRTLKAMALYAPLIEVTDTATVLAALDG